MLVKVTAEGRVLLDAPEDFRRFAVSIDPIAAARGLDREALAGIGRQDGPEHIWISPETVCRLAAPADPASWAEGFRRMLAYAAERGWVSADGELRAHIEPARP